jgi:16S rRNA (cytosine1402-N4)-methyltransferase
LAFDSKEKRFHEPVLLSEVVGHLEPERGGWFLDCTFGEGGHTGAIASCMTGDGGVFAVELDPDLAVKGKGIYEGQERIIVIHGNYANLSVLLEGCPVKEFNGIVLDLGFSSYHLGGASRGFSFQKSEPLDMRYHQEGEGVSAAQVLNTFPEKKLRDILSRLGEERDAKKIARVICHERKNENIDTSMKFRELILKAKRGGRKKEKIDPATRSFQALRIFVNGELENLESFLSVLPRLLSKGGRVAVISYHSLEDRLVKNYFRKYSGQCICPPGLPMCACGKEKWMKVLTSKPVRPSDLEISRNRRARSARLRVGERIT